MKTYISMLRGINVGGKKKIKMEDLKELYRSIDLKVVKTYIQSGNVVFQYQDGHTSEIAQKIQKEIMKVFNFDVPVFIRTENELKKIINNNPFKKEDKSKLYVTFLNEVPIEKPIEEINQIKDKSEMFYIFDKEIYLFCPNGYARTKLSNDFFEKKLKVSATTRNWKTVNKLLDIAKR
jgi:uncharacterized protein (DUF1697 family)